MRSINSFYDIIKGKPSIKLCGLPFKLRCAREIVILSSLATLRLPFVLLVREFALGRIYPFVQILLF